MGKRADVEWLPAYAPELNPVEQIWNYGKYSQLANFILEDVDHLAFMLNKSLNHQAKQKDLLRSFFHCAKLII
ncbi:transposase [Planctomycetota bacterium]